MICGTAVFVCLVCGGAESDDRFTLRFHSQEVIKFLTAARKVFQMIDDDDSGTLEKAEIVLPGVVLIIREVCRTLLRPSTRRHTRLTHR